mgnify:CR=1 FL=1
MEKVTYKVTLADGTAIENLTLSSGANTFHSAAEINKKMFDGKLSEVHITASNGDMSQCVYPDTLHNAELIQIMQPADTPDGTWQFILREIPEEELKRAALLAQINSLKFANDDMILMMADLIGG